MLGLKNLRGNAKADVTGLLDAAVHVNIAVIDDKDEEVWSGVVSITGLVPGLGNYKVLVGVEQHLSFEYVTYQVLPHQQACPAPPKATCRA